MSLTKTTTSKGNYQTSRIWNGKWAIWKLNHTKAGLSEKDYRENQRSARRLEREPWLQLYILLHCAKLLHFILASATLLHFVLASATLLHCATLLHFILACATLLHCATLCYMATLIQWKKTKRKINGVQGAVIAIGPSLIPSVRLSQASRCYLGPRTIIGSRAKTTGPTHPQMPTQL